MKIWFDTEFIEDGKTIDLISIGMVREDGKTYYAQNLNCQLDRASDWVKANVLSQLNWSIEVSKLKSEIAREVIEFAGENPEFWAYYADYDWVVLCQLYGDMMQLPSGWPMLCMDVKQYAVMLGNPQLPKQKKDEEHHALADAIWCKRAWDFLELVRECAQR